jgi:hypothetical protein
MLLNLPAEILWEIWRALSTNRPASNAFVQTSRRLYDTFNAHIYMSVSSVPEAGADMSSQTLV